MNHQQRGTHHVRHAYAPSKTFVKNVLLICICLLLQNVLSASVKSGSGTLHFDSNADGASEMTLTSQGLAISSNVASANLHVSGNAMISDSLTIGSSTSSSSNLYVSGTIGFSVGSYTGNVGIEESVKHSIYVINNSGGNSVIVLPDPTATSGRRISVNATSSTYDLLVHTYTGNIDGSKTLIVDAGTKLPSVSLYSNGTNWYILSSNAGNTTGKSYLELVVKTDETGTSNNDQFTLPLLGSSSYNFDVDWGDGNSETITTSSSPTHTYGSSGTYNVRITENVVGGFPTIKFNNGGDRYKLLHINNWGDNTWATMNYSFRGCGNMTITASDLPVTGGVTNFDYAFSGCSSIKRFPLVDTSSATSLRDMFFQCNSLVEVALLNTSNVTNFENCFRGCNSLASLPLLDTSSGTNFRSFIRDCSSLTTMPLIDTSSGTDFNWMCSGTAGLSGTDFPLLNFGSASGAASLVRALPSPSLSSYSALLVDIASKNLNTGITLTYGGDYNTSGNTARDTLVGRGWTITGSYVP